ncbi:unnamed protein product [Caenorhabditis auriculariae]|uniref:Chorein N-terminal domain-containing protein n=1 Tax=Caenorhabditis auriculariae TaxID=2777116 RepID=A0A8S1HP72_9PELO|nr:unnamed protein product [Caenorhabditis auriculariae]
MLENVVAWVLNNYIGEYLENLNTDQLSVALLSGQVELENVPLKKSALRKLDLPLEVRSGLLGRLTLSVPITRLRSEPWTLKLCDVLVIVGPPSADKRYDVEAVEQVEQQRKEQMLGDLEQRHKTALLDLLGIPAQESQDSWWGASLISTVLNNIQLILNNVHIRYEDDSTLTGGVPFNVGIRIQKMTMQTTNAHWKPGFVESRDGVNVFKKLELSGFSIYWNSNTKMSEDYDSPKKIRAILAPETTDNAYIIEPCNSELRMEKNSSKFPLKQKIPRFKFFLRPEIINCELTRRQMTELRALNREWARFERARVHRKWRPLTHVGGNAKEWWQFAYGRITEETRRTNVSSTWDFAAGRAKFLNSYCRAYRRRLLGLISNPNASDAVADPSAAGFSATQTTANSMSLDDRTTMKQIERDAQFSYHELHLFREMVFRRLVRDKEQEMGIETSRKPSPGMEDEQFETIEPPPPDEVLIEDVSLPDVPAASGGLYNWITGFFSQQPLDEKKDENAFDFGKIDVSELRKMPSHINMKEMEDEILDVLHESWDDSTLLRRDSLLAEIALRLDYLTLRFVDSVSCNSVEQQRVLALQLRSVNAKLDVSPREHSLGVDLTVHDMSVQRLRTGLPSSANKDNPDSLLSGNTEKTKVLLAVGRFDDGRDDSKLPMFSMHYSRKSPRLIVHHVVNCRLRPVAVQYEEGALEGVANLFADDPFIYTVNSKNSAGSTIVTVAVEDPIPNPGTTPELSIIDSHVVVNLEVPWVRMTVHSCGWTDRSLRPLAKWDPGEAIACFNIERVNFGVISKEKHVSKIQVHVGHVNLADLLENTVHPLLSTSAHSTVNQKTSSLSTSCPDLQKNERSSQKTNDSEGHVASSSVPSESYLDKFLQAQDIPLRTNSLTSTLDSQVTSPLSITSAVSRTNPTDKPEVAITILLVDRQHVAFETKYAKKHPGRYRDPRKKMCDFSIEQLYCKARF